MSLMPRWSSFTLPVLAALTVVGPALTVTLLGLGSEGSGRTWRADPSWEAGTGCVTGRLP